MINGGEVKYVIKTDRLYIKLKEEYFAMLYRVLLFFRI